MGGVGQKLTNNVSYAVQLSEQGKYLGIYFKAIGPNADKGLYQEIGNLNLGDMDFVAKGVLTENAKIFGSLVACSSEVVREEIDEENGVVNKPSSNVSNVVLGLKNSLYAAFSNAFDEYLTTTKAKGKSLAAYYNAFKEDGSANIEVDLPELLKKDKRIQVLLDDEVSDAASEAKEFAGGLIELSNAVLSPSRKNEAQLFILVQEGKLTLQSVAEFGSSEPRGVCVYLSSNVDDLPEGFLDFFNALKFSEAACQSISSAVGNFQTKIAGNYVQVDGKNYKLVNDLKNVSVLGTLAAIATYLNKDDKVIDQDVIKSYKDIANGLQNIDEKLLDDSYGVLSQANPDVFPPDCKDSSVNFVMKVKKYYEADLDDSEIKLRQDFDFGNFSNACKIKDAGERIGEVLKAAFGLDAFSEYLGFSKTASTHLAFLVKMLGGNVGGQKTKPKANPGSGSGKPGSGKPGQPGEKKGFSTGAKVAMGITIPAAVLAATGVALWKTGYGAKIWGKIKTLMNKDGNRRPDIKFNSQGKEPVVKN
jgi:hypothetical protein